jgi:hypothetical protein
VNGEHDVDLIEDVLDHLHVHQTLLPYDLESRGLLRSVVVHQIDLAGETVPEQDADL